MVKRIVDEKYIVFNREEFERWIYNMTPNRGIDPILDAVVIRKQDVFAPPALDAYANAITCVIGALKTVGTNYGLVEPEMNDQVKKLQGIADYFRAQAEDAYDMKRKLPD